MKYAILLMAMMLAACAHAPAEPIVDMRGVDQAQYQADVAECRGYVEQVDAAGNTAGSTVAGAVIGGAFGAVIGAVFHVPMAGAALGAATGGFGAGTGGFAASMARKNVIMNRCLLNRGYKVLG